MGQRTRLKYTDEVKRRVLELIQKKIDGSEIIEAPVVQSDDKIIDLMAALKASLASRGSKKIESKQIESKKARPKRADQTATRQIK